MRLLVVLWLASLFVPLSACTRGAEGEASVRSALNAYATVIDPASRLAFEACAQRQLAIASDVRAGKLGEAEGRAQVADVRARCVATRAVFDAMRSAHDEAVRAVEAGVLAEARDKLEAIRLQWESGRIAPPTLSPMPVSGP